MIKITREITKTDYNLLIAQDLWQAHSPISLIIFQKEFIKVNLNTETMIKKCETCGVKYKDCVSFFEYTSFKDDLIEYKCLCCKKKKKIVENLKKQFFDTYKLSNQDVKLILLFWKVVNFHEYIDYWEKNSIWHHYLKKKISTIT